MRAFPLMATALLALAPIHAATAQDAMGSPNMVESGGYVVHFNAVPTTQIPPAAARSYRITRSPNRALLNIAVQKKGEAANQARSEERRAGQEGTPPHVRSHDVRNVR